MTMVAHVTKFSAYVGDVSEIEYLLDKAIFEATHGRKGGVLLDIPMNILRSEFPPNDGFSEHKLNDDEKIQYNMNAKKAADEIIRALSVSKAPVVLFGAGVKSSDSIHLARDFINKYHIPVVTSMIAVDVIKHADDYYGFIGAYGHRTANFLLAKCDLLICFGVRLDIRQVGRNRSDFASNAQVIRIDIDQEELLYKVHENEIDFHADAREVLRELMSFEPIFDIGEWITICKFIRSELLGFDDKEPNIFVRQISKYIPDNAIITTDVGQNQVWVSQSLEIKPSQKVLYSGSNGAMGYSLPAAIGACIAGGNKTTFSFNGDGGIQMNIQELQTIVRENLPINIVIFNNNALGMIRHFQEMYFEGKYFMTKKGNGYSNPDFKKIAEAYGIKYVYIERVEDINDDIFEKKEAKMVEIGLDYDTYVFPKLKFGNPNQDQEPPLEREIYNRIMNNDEIMRIIDERR